MVSAPYPPFLLGAVIFTSSLPSSQVLSAPHSLSLVMQGHILTCRWCQPQSFPSFLLQDNLPPEELHEKLLTVISEGDDVQQVSRYLCKGAPMEHLGGRCLSALQLAVITDRRRTVSLLLASGASLSASLLQEAWHSPDVTPKVLAALITVSILVFLSHNKGTPRRCGRTVKQERDASESTT